MSSFLFHLSLCSGVLQRPFSCLGSRGVGIKENGQGWQKRPRLSVPRSSDASKGPSTVLICKGSKRNPTSPENKPLQGHQRFPGFIDEGEGERERGRGGSILLCLLFLTSILPSLSFSLPNTGTPHLTTNQLMTVQNGSRAPYSLVPEVQGPCATHGPRVAFWAPICNILQSRDRNSGWVLHTLLVPGNKTKKQKTKAC